jgi:hypothetical protein
VKSKTIKKSYIQDNDLLWVIWDSKISWGIWRKMIIPFMNNPMSWILLV